MGQKLFSNKTPSNLNATLVVRKGDQPGHEADTRTFVIPAGRDESYQYSGDNNPYLDAVTVTSNGNGGQIGAEVRVLSRGSAVDNALNMNDHITFTQTGESLVMTFRNG
jgi:hypothetical protein